ncbi:MAG: NADH-quinone oxidoreductase subunit C [Planctomycetota bacterium]
MQNGLTADELLKLLTDGFAVERDAADRWSLTVRVARDKLHALIKFLRDDPRLAFDQLLDVAGIDYLSYPDWRGPRFAVSYPLKSTTFRHRVIVKVLVEEDDAKVPSLNDLYRSANYAERETWDQYGVVFTGHPNLKRLLNHHEFIGHPLRKDYPCQKRQKLSVNDPMLDQLAERVTALGYQIIEGATVHPGAPMTVKNGAAS